MTKRRIEMKGFFEGECECSFTDGIKCLLYGDIEYAKFLKELLESHSPQNKQESCYTKTSIERLDYIINQFEV